MLTLNIWSTTHRMEVLQSSVHLSSRMVLSLMVITICMVQASTRSVILFPC